MVERAFSLQAVAPATVMTFTDPAPRQRGIVTGRHLLCQKDAKISSSGIDELHGLLIRSIKRRLRADVPIGLFLSAGIDPTLLLQFVRMILIRSANFHDLFPDGLDEFKQAEDCFVSWHKPPDTDVLDDPFNAIFQAHLSHFMGPQTTILRP